ncbi:MAG: hypothetical protein IPH74_11895 [Bacteroidetes bacterium]|nr:hypothetical protein [Bacteroidota bacterium]
MNSKSFSIVIVEIETVTFYTAYLGNSRSVIVHSVLFCSIIVATVP